MRHLSKLTMMLAAAGFALAAVPASAQTTLEKVREAGVMTAGSSAAYPPFEYVENGTLVGFDVDLAAELGKRMGVEIEFEKIDFKGIIAALQSSRVDSLITALTFTPERAERIAFSMPYYDAGIGAIVPADSDVVEPADLKGKIVGVQLGSSGERYVRGDLADVVGEVKSYDSIVLAINDLKNGRVDAVVNPLPVLGFNIRNTDGFKPTPVWSQREVGINTRKEDTALMDEINTHLEAMKAEGFMDTLAQKWFGAN